MYGYIYLTTNLINNKIYIGKHQCDHYDNKYYGSGTILEQTIKKYGKENFDNKIIDTANTQDELNQKEIYYIHKYKQEYKNECYNIAFGGDGRDTFSNKTDIEKAEFINKMTIINRERCNTADFKEKISTANKKRYEDPKVREEHSKKIKEYWTEDKCNEHKKLLKKYYQEHTRDYSFNNKQCVFELNDIYVEFESVKALRQYLIDQYHYNPDRRSFAKLMQQGKDGIPYKAFHSKFNYLNGMKIYYKQNKSVETIDDECNRVEQEISTCSKCETIDTIEDIVQSY